MESVLRIRLRSEFSFIETILEASLSLALLWRKSVNLNPYFCRPFLQILPNRPKPLIASLKQEFSQGVFCPKIPGFGKKPPQPIRLRSSINSFNYNSFFGMAGDTFFKGIGTCSISSSSRAFGILLTTLNPSTYSGFPPPEFHPLITTESQQTNCWWFEK